MTAPSRFDEQGVLLNELGLAAAGRFFPLRDLQGATVHVAHRRVLLAIVIGLAGVAAMIASLWVGHTPLAIAGLMLVGVAVLNWSIQSVVHYLYVDTSAGAREAVASVDVAFLERVAQAVNQAVAERGQAAG